MAGEHGIDHQVHVGDADLVLEIGVVDFPLRQRELISPDRDAPPQEVVEQIAFGAAPGRRSGRWR